MVIWQDADQAAASARLQKRCELSSITLISCELEKQKDVDSLEQPFRLGFRHRATPRKLQSGATDLRVDVAFTFVSLDSSSPAKRLFILDCEFLAEYTLDDGATPSEEEIIAFAKANAIFNCWPYAREFLQNMTARMELPTPPLPYLRLKTKPKTGPTTLDKQPTAGDEPKPVLAEGKRRTGKKRSPDNV